MIRLLRGEKLVVASHNRGKVREIRELLTPYGLQTAGAADLGLAEPEETGSTFAANAKLKAEAAVLVSGRPALADDSGLCVAGLGGAPGVHSARWAGLKKDFRAAMERVERELGGNPDKRAVFVCVLALAKPGAETECFEGRVFGALTFPPRGERGFGYDPIFVPEGGRFTFGEMEEKAKHAISHRASAFEKFTSTAILPYKDQ